MLRWTRNTNKKVVPSGEDENSLCGNKDGLYQTTLVLNGNPKLRITPVSIHAGSSLLGVLWAETAIHQANNSVCLMIVCF